MANFPRREADAIELADAMILGYLGNPGIFHSCDISSIQSARALYGSTKGAQMTTQAQAALAMEQKEHALIALEEIMRHELRKSETDTVADPAQLKLIGWGPKSQPAPSDKPGQPRNFESIQQGRGKLVLDWKRPPRGSGGPVRNYSVERRENEEGEMTEWHSVGTAIETEIHLEDQPRAVSMEYRVVAVNVGGEGKPSNIIDVVL